MIPRWLWSSSADHGFVRPWNPVIADRHAEATARLLLGSAGPVRVTSNRIVERREAQVAERRLREATQQAVVLAWRGRTT